jgi:hypothetical protein
MTTGQFTNITSPRWANADQTSLDVTVSIEGIGNNLPYTVEPNSELWHDVLAGKFGAIAPHDPPQIDYASLISARGRAMLEAPYGDKRGSVNNYFTQLASTPAEAMTNEDQRDLDALRAAANWEQSILDKRDDFLQDPTADTWALAQDPASWPPFPPEAAEVVELC